MNATRVHLYEPETQEQTTPKMEAWQFNMECSAGYIGKGRPITRAYYIFLFSSARRALSDLIFVQKPTYKIFSR